MMEDKNGVEMKTGMVVRITGAYFKNDNGLYFVIHSPGDPSWCGSDYCLRKVGKKGKVSTAKYNLCFWPISICTNDWRKRAEGNEWNRKNAEIEVVENFTMNDIKRHFLEEAEKNDECYQHEKWHFGEDSEIVKKYALIRDFYQNIGVSL